MPGYRPGDDTVMAVIEPPPQDVLARLHGGPYDGHAVPMLNWPGLHDTVVIEDDEGPTQPVVRYVPRAVQPHDRRYRDLDFENPEGS
jgi:hypothetical protein